MQARDIMQTRVITARPASTLGEIAKLLLDNTISAVPIVGGYAKLVGIVSAFALRSAARQLRLDDQDREADWL